MKNFWKTVCAVALVGVVALPVQAEEKTITVGTMSWEDLTPITGITKKVLENAGYSVKVVEFSEIGIAYAALTKGDVQVLASQTDYATQDYWNKNKNRLEKLSPVSYGLYQAIAVPKYVDIDSLEQLNDNADKFGGKIIGIEPGSGLMSDANKAVKDYGFKLQLLEGSTAAMTAALKSAVDRKEWVAVTIWEPSWMAQKFDLKFLKDPKGSFAPRRPITGSVIRASPLNTPTPAKSSPASTCRLPTSPPSTAPSRTARAWIRPLRAGPTTMPT